MERLAREAVRQIPDGLYEAEDFVDDNGHADELLRVAVRLTISGDAVDIDMPGSSAQTKDMINSPLASTISATYGAFAILLGGSKFPVNGLRTRENGAGRTGGQDGLPDGGRR